MQYSLFDGVGNPNEEALRAFNHPLNVVPQQHNPAALTGDAGVELTYNKRNRIQRISWDDIKEQNATLRIKEVVKVETIERGGERNGFLIPDNLRAKVNAEGLPLFSYGQLAPSGASNLLHIDDIREEISRLIGQWPGAPEITIVENVPGIPLECNPKARGVYHDGKVYIVADKIHSIKELQTVMAHECTMHHTIFQMMDSYEYSKIHEGIQSLKKRGDPVINALADDIRSKYGSLSPEDETAEIIAHAGERCLDDRGNVKIEYGFIKSVFAGINSFLRDRGFNIRFTNAELQGIICNAGKQIERNSQYSLKFTAEPDGYYVGKILDVNANKVIQKTGRRIIDITVHDLSKFDQIPLIGDAMEFRYQNGRLKVVEQKIANGLGRA